MHKKSIFLSIILLLAILSNVQSLLLPYRKMCPGVKLKNGRVRYRSKSGGFAQFQCNRGHLLAGEKYMKCVNGSWEGEIPHCVRSSCTKGRSTENGFVYPSHRGAVLTFFCKAGFELKGTSVVYCDGDKWSNPLPPCIASDKNISLNCDFEREDLCGWTHDINHDFDWTRMKFSTPSGHIGTGPSHDHTPGLSGEGYYMYIEATSRNVNDTARLISPTYLKQEHNTCLEFYYHMLGAFTGELRVYIKKISESWDLNVDNAVFKKSGNQGNKWKRSLINLGNIDEEFQVIMEGVRGTSYSSDIAIDDVRIIENCEENEEQEVTYSTTIDWEGTSEDIYGGDYSCTDKCEVNDDNFLCSCSTGCILNNTCCADYIAICLLGDDTFTEDYQTTEDIILSTVDDSTSPIMEEESFTAMTSSPESTIKSTTTPTNKPKIKLTNKPSIKPTIKQSPITKQPIKQIITTRNFTTNTSYVTNLQRKVYVITRKPMYPPSNIKPTIKQVPNMATTTLTLITPKIILKKPPQVIKITPKPNNRAENEILKNDISIVPVNENNDEELLVTQRNVPILKEKKLESQKIIKTSVGGGTSTTVVIIAVVCIAMGAVLTVVIMRRRYMCVRFKNIRSRSCGDSQSDVRFLTGDEILDFTPATPK